MNNIPLWTAEEYERVAGMLRDGLSASQIARCFPGLSRNAIIGRVHRSKELKAIGFAGEPWGHKHRQKKSKIPGVLAAPKVKPTLGHNPFGKKGVAGAREAKAAPKLTAPVSIAAPAPHVGKPLPLLALQSGQCRFAVREDRAVVGGHLFCAAPVADGSSWCPHHHSICTGTGTAIERGAGRALTRLAA